MGVILRQSFKGTIVSYMGAVLGALSTLFIVPMFLDPKEIGLTRVLLDTAIFFAALAQAGIPNVIVRYFPYFKDSESNHKGFFWFITFLPFVTFLLVALIFLSFKSFFIALFSENAPLFVHYYFLILPLAFFNMYGSIYESYSASLQRITVPKIIREVIVRILTMLLIVAFGVFSLHLDIFVFYFVFIYLFFFILNLFYLFKITSVGLPKLRHKDLPRRFYIEVVRFMMFMIVSGIGANLVSKIDVLMITSMAGLSYTGIYSIAFYLASIIEIPSRSTIQMSLPFISEAIKNNDIEKVKSLYVKNTLNQWIVGGLLLIVMIINLKNIYQIMPNGKIFEEGYYVVLFIAIAKFIDLITGMNNYIITYSKYYKYSFYLVFLLAGLTFLTNLVFIPEFGIAGAAFATMFSVLICNIIIVWIVYVKMKIQPFTLANLGVAAVMIACIGVNWILPELNNFYIDSIIRTTVVSLLFLIVTYKANFSPDFNDLLRRFSSIKELIKFMKGK